MRGRDEHRTLSLCGVSTFLNKLSLAQHAYFKQEISLKKRYSAAFKGEHTFKVLL